MAAVVAAFACEVADSPGYYRPDAAAAAVVVEVAYSDWQQLQQRPRQPQPPQSCDPACQREAGAQAPPRPSDSAAADKSSMRCP